jgi:hypothetical protein
MSVLMRRCARLICHGLLRSRLLRRLRLLLRLLRAALRSIRVAMRRRVGIIWHHAGLIATVSDRLL